MKNIRTIAVATAVVASLLTASAFATPPGGSNLGRMTIHEVIPREPSVGAMTHDVALSRLRRKGYSPSTLVLKGGKWKTVDAKTGHSVQIDARTGKVNESPSH